MWGMCRMPAPVLSPVSIAPGVPLAMEQTVAPPPSLHQTGPFAREEEAMCPFHVGTPVGASNQEKKPLQDHGALSFACHPNNLWAAGTTNPPNWEDSEAGRGDMMACHTALRMKPAFEPRVHPRNLWATKGVSW